MTAEQIQWLLQNAPGYLLAAAAFWWIARVAWPDFVRQRDAALVAREEEAAKRETDRAVAQSRQDNRDLAFLGALEAQRRSAESHGAADIEQSKAFAQVLGAHGVALNEKISAVMVAIAALRESDAISDAETRAAVVELTTAVVKLHEVLGRQHPAKVPPP